MKLISLTLLLATVANLLALSVGFEMSVNVKEDINPILHDWNFPQDRPYTYFDNTSAIPHSFLPLKVEAIPEGSGLWILRYKDFSGSSLLYAEGKDASISTIRVSSKALLFHSIRIKAILYGEAKLELVHRPIKGKLEKVDMGAYYKRCSSMNKESDEVEDAENDDQHYLKWTTYQFEIEPTGHVTLNARIFHPYSFIIIDEMSIAFSDDDDSKVNVYNGFQDMGVNGTAISRLLCKVHP